jgi:hypothetical protein
LQLGQGTGILKKIKYQEQSEVKQVCGNCMRNKINGGNCDTSRSSGEGCFLFVDSTKESIDYGKFSSGIKKVEQR